VLVKKWLNLHLIANQGKGSEGSRLDTYLSGRRGVRNAGRTKCRFDLNWGTSSGPKIGDWPVIMRNHFRTVELDDQGKGSI